jgi:hypothetical protein
MMKNYPKTPKGLGIRMAIISAMLVLATGLSAATKSVRTAPYVVTNNHDSGWGSLREAITDAKNNPGPDVITFDAATNGKPIILEGAAYEDGNLSGDLDILDPSDLTITGNGEGVTIIDGGGIDRVFHICPGGGCTNTVVLSGVTIRNGNTGGSGGIYNQATLNLTNSTIGGAGVGNQATNGGGIYSSAGTTTTLEGCTVSNNTANYGAGIYNNGILSITNSTISTNTAIDDGGGIYNNSTINIQNDSTIGPDNSATNGGGIYNKTGTTTISNSTVSDNDGTKGGGAYNLATLNIQNGSTIGGANAGNQVTEQGGGIYNETGQTTVDGSTISSNQAPSGGGIYNWGKVNIQNGSTIGGVGMGNNAATGGGIYNRVGATTIVNNCTISANTATMDGGGITNWGTLYILNGSTIGGAGGSNSAEANGGGILNRDGTTTVDASTISINQADRGGGIHNWGTLLIQNGSTIGGIGGGNTAESEGGGIFNQSGTTNVKASHIMNNVATLDGGGIYMSAGSATVTNSRILNNMAQNGGGVYNNRDDPWVTYVTGSCIVGNSDMSFFNNHSKEQIATGNWWGVPTGPNTPGADTVAGNVTYAGYLSAPILGCTPDLQVTKTNDTAGNCYTKIPFHWILMVTNPGLTRAIFSTTQTILVDTLPSGPTYGTPTIAGSANVTNPENIDCAIASDTLTCQASSGAVILEASGSFTISVSVIPNQEGTLTNPAGTCQVDPDGKLVESDEGNNNCPSDSVTVVKPTFYLYLPLIRD